MITLIPKVMHQKYRIVDFNLFLILSLFWIIIPTQSTNILIMFQTAVLKSIDQISPKHHRRICLYGDTREGKVFVWICRYVVSMQEIFLLLMMHWSYLHW